MEILVKLPFQKWERKHVGQRDQLMTLDCTVKEVKPDGSVLLEFDDTYLAGLADDKLEIFQEVLHDYQVPAPRRQVLSPEDWAAALADPYLSLEGLQRFDSVEAPSPLENSDEFRLSWSTAPISREDYQAEKDAVAVYFGPKGEHVIDPARARALWEDRQNQFIRGELPEIAKPSAILPALPEPVPLPVAATTEDGWVVDPLSMMYSGVINYLDDCDCAYCAEFGKTRRQALLSEETFLFEFLSDSELEALPSKAKNEILRLRREVQEFQMRREMEKQLLAQMQVEVENMLDDLLKSVKGKIFRVVG